MSRRLGNIIKRVTTQIYSIIIIGCQALYFTPQKISCKNKQTKKTKTNLKLFIRKLLKSFLLLIKRNTLFRQNESSYFKTRKKTVRQALIMKHFPTVAETAMEFHSLKR